jgi:hypothetical protein
MTNSHTPPFVQLPFFLIGAYVAAGTSSAGEDTDAEINKNPKLKSLVSELKKLIHKGGQQQLLQRRPHWVLLSMSFYENELLRLFVDLSILW